MTLTHIADLQTPCLVLDRQRMERNIARMNAKVTGLGVSLRPHVKTNKSASISRMMVGAHSGGITVSTLAEAQYFLDAGFTDILYAVGAVPGKLDAVLRLVDKGADLKIILDNAETATKIAAHAAKIGLSLNVLLEFDCDGHRAGFDPGDPELVRAARILADASSTDFAGVLTHAGASYGCRSTTDIRRLASHEWRTAAECSARLHDEGLDCPFVSVGSTPTALFAQPIPGVTEVRAGVYVFFDLFQANLGVCEREDIALTVLTTVVGHKQSLGRLIIDAGALALSKDAGTRSQSTDYGFGLLCDGETGEILGDLIVDVVNQEHGIVVGRNGPIDFRRYPIGSMLRVMPIHACMTAAGHDQYQVVCGTESRVEAVWERCRGW